MHDFPYRSKLILLCTPALYCPGEHYLWIISWPDYTALGYSPFRSSQDQKLSVFSIIQGPNPAVKGVPYHEQSFNRSEILVCQLLTQSLGPIERERAFGASGKTVGEARGWPRRCRKREQLDIAWVIPHDLRSAYISLAGSSQTTGMNLLGRDPGVWICAFAFYSGMNLLVSSSASIAGKPCLISHLPLHQLFYTIGPVILSNSGRPKVQDESGPHFSVPPRPVPLAVFLWGHTGPCTVEITGHNSPYTPLAPMSYLQIQLQTCCFCVSAPGVMFEQEARSPL